MEEVPALPDDVLDLGRRLIPEPVFLLGCARSGTSIFGEALAAHPRVVYLFEVSHLWREAIEERDDDRLERIDAKAGAAVALYRSLAREAEGLLEGSGTKAGREVTTSPLGGRILLEKNPKHVLRISFLDVLFPWARFLHIIRDGRDTVASLMFRNRGRSWGHLKVPGWKELLERYPEKNHVRCAHQWRDAVRIAREEGRLLGPDRYLEVRYEDLVRGPRETISSTLAFLGLGPHPAVDAFLGRVQDETAGSYHARRQVRHYIENHARRIGRYRENLSDIELREVMEVAGELLEELGYLRGET